MQLIAKLLKEKYTLYSQEISGYRIAHKIFFSYCYDIAPISVNSSGLDIKEFIASNAQIVYITPSHQYLTGVAMPITNRIKLINHIKQIGGVIIKDDYDSELVYNNRPIPSLQGLSDGDNVIFRYFCKSLISSNSGRVYGCTKMV